MKLTEAPTVPVVGAVVKVTDNPAVMVIVDEALATTALVSVTFTFTVKIPPEAYVWDWVLGFVAPPATSVDPSPKFQLNEYGVVPPEAETVKLTGVPGPPDVGAVVKLNVSARGAMVIVAEAVCVALFASVTLTLTVKLPLAS